MDCYAGTFSAGLVFRSHVTPNACSAALNALDASLRASASSLTERPRAPRTWRRYRTAPRLGSLALAFSAAFSPCACQGKSLPLSASLRRFSSRAVPLSARFSERNVSDLPWQARKLLFGLLSAAVVLHDANDCLPRRIRQRRPGVDDRRQSWVKCSAFRSACFGNASFSKGIVDLFGSRRGHSSRAPFHIPTVTAAPPRW